MSLDHEEIVNALIIWGVPLASGALAVGVAMRRQSRRWWYAGGALALIAVVVMVGAYVWFSNGCSEDDCTPAIGGGLVVLWLVLAACLGLLLAAVALKAVRR